LFVESLCQPDHPNIVLARLKNRGGAEV